MAVWHMRNKNMQYIPNLWPNRRNFRVLDEIEVEEHHGDVRFYTGSGNMVVSCMRNEKYAIYIYMSIIIALAQ